MDSLVGLTIPTATALLELNVPTLLSYVRMSEPELAHLFSLGVAQEMKKVLVQKHFLHDLCRRYALDLTDDFDRTWLLHGLFHEKNNLQTILKHYEDVFRLTKALKKAAKVARFDFVDEILTSKRLWCSFRHVRAVCRGCCWSKAKVDHYLEKFLSMHSDALERELEEYGEGETATDIQAICKYRATLKGYRKSGYEIDNEIPVQKLVLYQQWDLVRQRLKELKKYPMHLPADCLDWSRANIFLNYQEVPDDIKPYVAMRPIKAVNVDDINLKTLQKLDIDPGHLEYGYYSYKDRVQNATKAVWLIKNNFDIHNPRPLTDFVSTYMLDPEADLTDLMPNFAAVELVQLDSDDGYEEKFTPTINGEHPERCTEFVIWCLEKGLHGNEDFRAVIKANLNYVFGLLLECDQFGEENIIYADWYDPLSIQYFCEHHLEAFVAFAGTKDQLKQHLLKRVDGDELMEAYVKAL